MKKTLKKINKSRSKNKKGNSKLKNNVRGKRRTVKRNKFKKQSKVIGGGLFGSKSPETPEYRELTPKVIYDEARKSYIRFIVSILTYIENPENIALIKKNIALKIFYKLKNDKNNVEYNIVETFVNIIFDTIKANVRNSTEKIIRRVNKALRDANIQEEDLVKIYSVFGMLFQENWYTFNDGSEYGIRIDLRAIKHIEPEIRNKTLSLLIENLTRENSELQTKYELTSKSNENNNGSLQGVNVPQSQPNSIEF
jgi:hypothetical protein